MIGCYIIHSQKLNRFYIGATTDFESRLEKHISHFHGNNRFTSTATDWELFLFIPTNEYSHAVRLERKIKSKKSAVYIQNIKKYSELFEKLLNETL